MRFGRRGSDKFADIAHAPGISGAPLIEGLAPIFECEVPGRAIPAATTRSWSVKSHFVERNHDPLVFHLDTRRIDKVQPRAPAPASNSALQRSYLSYLLARASFNVSSSFHARLKEWDLTVPEWRVLACLADVEGAVAAGELAAMALMKQPA